MNQIIDPSITTATGAVRTIWQRRNPAVFLRLLSATGDAEEYTYCAVVDRARAWTEHLQERGLAPGSRVNVILPHSIDLYAAYLGALLGGLVPAMFAIPSAKLPIAEYGKTIGKLLSNARPRCVVTSPQLRSALLPYLSADQRRLLECGNPQICTPLEDSDWQEPNPDDVAFLQYSSGTTGLKKGVAISHSALLWQVRAYAQAIGLSETDTIVSWLPLYHDMGLICCFFLPLLTGTPVVAMSPFDWVKRPVMLLEAVTKHQATLCWMPNFAYNFLARTIREDELSRCKLSSLRGLVNCSEPLMSESHRRFVERFSPCGFRPDALAASYAMAETTFAITSGGFSIPLCTDVVDAVRLTSEQRAIPVPSESAEAKMLVSSGGVLDGTEVRIVAENGGELEDRCIGEIAVRAPCLLRDYDDNPEATAASLRQGWFYTGDLGYKANGHLFVTGRKKDLIILAGKNLYPQDIEDAVNQVPGVIPGRVVAFGVSDPAEGTERLVILAETGQLNEELRAAVTHAIYAAVVAQTDGVAADVQLVKHRWLVKSSSGKISRPANRTRYLEQLRGAEPMPKSSAQATGSTASARGDIRMMSSDEVLRAIIDCVVQVAQAKRKPLPLLLNSETLLFKTGLLDSLSVVSLMMELESRFGRVVPVESLDPRHFESVGSIYRLLREGSNPLVSVGAEEVDRDSGGFDEYVSLGFNCEPGLQFQRIGYDESSFFRFTFTSIESTFALVQNDFEGVFLKENVMPHCDNMVRDTRYDIMFHCELRSSVDPASGDRRFNEDYDFDQVYHLYYALTIRHLVEKWRALMSSRRRVLFVLKLEEGAGRVQAEKLHRTLRDRYPALRYTLLCLQPQDHWEPDWRLPGLVNRYLRRFAPIDNAHDADVASWDALFNEFPLKRRQSAAAPVAGPLGRVPIQTGFLVA